MKKLLMRWILALPEAPTYKGSGYVNPDSEIDHAYEVYCWESNIHEDFLKESWFKRWWYLNPGTIIYNCDRKIEKIIERLGRIKFKSQDYDPFAE
jgi:hypothetical protein